MARILHKEPRKLRSINNKVPVDIETICLKALEKDPDQRYQTAGQLAEDLRRFVSRFAIVAKRTGPVGRLVRWTQRHPAIAVLLALVVVSVCAAGTFAWQAYQVARLSRIDAYEPTVLNAVMKMERRGVDRIDVVPWLTSSVGSSSQAPGSGGDDLDAVLAELQEAIVAVPDRPDAYYRLARCLQILERNGEALEILEEALRRHPHFVPALILRPTLLARQRRFEEARRLAQEVRTSEQSEWAVAYQDAHEALQRRQWNRAVKAYDRLLDLQEAAGEEPFLGASVEMRLNKGVVYLKTKNFSEAIAAFREAHALQPQYLDGAVPGGYRALPGPSRASPCPGRRVYRRRKIGGGFPGIRRGVGVLSF